ncbi:MAG: hypothetical protein MZV70_39400 [Desulfobacterales bacterium]|nr:hypothetical protein [Desulfobacterales bacterium]
MAAIAALVLAERLDVFDQDRLSDRAALAPDVQLMLGEGLAQVQKRLSFSLALGPTI